MSDNPKAQRGARSTPIMIQQSFSTVSRLDYILLSPSLTEKSSAEQVIIEKRGLASHAEAYKGERFPGVGPIGTEASDHAAVFTTLKIS